MASQRDEKITGIVGNYTVTFSPVIGGGTFGQVMEANHNESRKKCAVKRIQITDGKTRNEDLYNMAKRELEIIKRLKDHINVISLDEVIFTDSYCYLVMEYCDHDLEGFLVQNPTITLLEKLQFMLQSANAVAFMHRQNPPIIHRDLKLKNILVKWDGDAYVVKLADFGLSKIFEDEFRASFSAIYTTTYMTTGCGSQYFQAPEFFEESDDGLMYDASVDIFSLGLVFAVVLQYGPDNGELKPLSVGVRQSGRIVNIGKEMAVTYLKGDQLPKIVKQEANDVLEEKSLKRVITYMTQYHKRDRKSIFEVEEELSEIVAHMMKYDRLASHLVEIEHKHSQQQIKNEHLKQTIVDRENTKTLVLQNSKNIEKVTDVVNDLATSISAQTSRIQNTLGDIHRDMHRTTNATTNKNNDARMQYVSTLMAVTIAGTFAALVAFHFPDVTDVFSLVNKIEDDTLKISAINKLKTELDISMREIIEQQRSDLMIKIDVSKDQLHQSLSEWMHLKHTELCRTHDISEETQARSRQTMSHIAGKTLYQKKSVNITLAPYSIRMVHDMLWVCQYNKIAVYDSNLHHVSNIPCTDMGRINGAVDVGIGVAVAADAGLFILHYNGSFLQTMRGGSFHDVDYLKGILYAVYTNKDSINIASYNNSTLIQTNNVQTPCGLRSHIQTIRVNGKYLALGCWTNDEVYLLKLGNSNATFDTISDTNESRFIGPYVVAIDNEDNVVVTDWYNHRIQMYQAGTWQTLQLEPQPRYPRSAVYVNDTLYVTGGNHYEQGYYITLYVI